MGVWKEPKGVDRCFSWEMHKLEPSFAISNTFHAVVMDNIDQIMDRDNWCKIADLVDS